MGKADIPYENTHIKEGFAEKSFSGSTDEICKASGYKFTQADCHTSKGTCKGTEADGCTGVGLCTISANANTKYYMDCCKKTFRYDRGECSFNSIPGNSCGGKFECVCNNSDVYKKDGPNDRQELYMRIPLYISSYPITTL